MNIFIINNNSKIPLTQKPRQKPQQTKSPQNLFLNFTHSRRNVKILASDTVKLIQAEAMLNKSTPNIASISLG